MSFLDYRLRIVKKPYLHHNTSNVNQKILNSKRHELFTKIHPLKTIIKLSIAPFVVIMVNAIYQMSDVMITAALIDDTILVHGGASSVATIAINTSMVVYLPLWGVVIGIVQGGLAWFSKSQGMQNPRNMGIFNSSIFVMIILSSFFISVIMLSTGRGILSLSVDITNPVDKNLIVNESFMYIWPRIATLPIVGIYLHSVRTMRILNVRWWTVIPYTVGVLLNLLLDYLFIRVGKLGIFGSGLATGCADVVGGSLALLFFIHFLKKEHPEVKLFNPKLWALRRVFLQGLPQMMSMLFVSIFMFAIINWSSNIGALAVTSVVRIISSLAIYPVMAFIQGSNIAMGYNYGWKNYKRLSHLVFWLLFLIFSYFVFVTLIVVLSSDGLLLALNVNEPQGGHWLSILYSATILTSFINALRAYYMSTHQKFKIFLTIVIWTFAPMPFFYLFGSYLADIELFWYGQVIGDSLSFLLVLLPWILLVKRYFTHLRKDRKDLFVHTIVIEKKIRKQ